ncbi:MAG: ABC transporter substrate-binding protein [Rhizobiaceae bacterium]|nr:ABC transporter substrate-binding protein [Rhizobiaceae bacterium]
MTRLPQQFGRFARAALTTMGFLGVGITASSAEDSIKFGVMTALSGPAAAWGQAELASVEIAADDINSQGGIKVGDKTYKLNVVAYDHGYDTTKAVTAARQAVSQDGVKFLEVLGGAPMAAVMTITEPEKVLAFGQAEGNHWLKHDTNYAFKIVFSVAANARANHTYISQTDSGARIVQFFPDDESGHSISEGILAQGRELGLDIEQMFIPRDVTDFYPIITRIMMQEPDYIELAAMPGAQYALLIKQALENGYSGKFVFSSTMDTGALKKAGVLENTVGSIAAPAYFLQPTVAGQRWIDEMNRKTGGNVQAWVSSSYDSLLLLKGAIESAGSLDPDAVRDALRTISVEGLSGKVNFHSPAGTDLPAHVLVAPVPVALVSEYRDGNVVFSKVFDLKN